MHRGDQRASRRAEPALGRSARRREPQTPAWSSTCAGDPRRRRRYGSVSGSRACSRLWADAHSSGRLGPGSRETWAWGDPLVAAPGGRVSRPGPLTFAPPTVCPGREAACQLAQLPLSACSLPHPLTLVAGVTVRSQSSVLEPGLRYKPWVRPGGTRRKDVDAIQGWALFRGRGLLGGLSQVLSEFVGKFVCLAPVCVCVCVSRVKSHSNNFNST